MQYVVWEGRTNLSPLSPIVYNGCMSHHITFRCLLAFSLLLPACLWPVINGRSACAAVKPSLTAEALVYTTMPSLAAHRPEMAVDGDPSTYFQSLYGMDDGDDFLILFSQPIPVQSLRVATGDNEHQDLLTGGFVETSPDGVHYRKAASFDNSGNAVAVFQNLTVQALRIRLNRGGHIPSLLIRDISVQTSARIIHAMQGPGRGFPDISRAPEVAAWAQRAERQMESFWPDTEALLHSDKFIPPNMVNVIYRTGPGVTGVAATGGGVMEVNTAWCDSHPEDTGLTVHETAHVIQAYSAYDPVWLVEGIADYIRWVKFEPEHFQYRIDPQKSTYHDSYRTTAAFLGWCELHYDSGLVTKLSHAVRFGNYKTSLFKQYCGKDVDTLWSEFVAAYKSDRAHVLTPPVAPEDQPRALPTVQAGSGVPVDLSAAFNTTGLSNDGAPPAGTAGFDGEGNTFSASLLGASPTWKGIPFKLGPANAADAVSCQGQTIALPSGSYASLWLLGSAVEGSQKAQTLTVTYTDGTTDELVQNFSDWFQPGHFPGESRAFPMDYRNMADGAKDSRTFNVYSYGFLLKRAKTVKSVTLPQDAYVKLLALTLAN